MVKKSNDSGFFGLQDKDVSEFLVQHGVFPTQQRRKIAQALFERPQHFTAEQVLAKVNSNGSVASKATIYNTLGLFVSKGLIREIIVDSSKSFYDSSTHPHHHFYHVDTGVLQDIDDQDMALQAFPTPPEGTELEGVDIIVRVRATKS
jgi:Fur family iron response transcriptional regulator